MGWDWLVALLLFEFATGFTPGPNNILALSIGFSHGYRGTLPHIFGVAFGFPVMLLAIGLFLKPLMDRYPMLFDLLRYLSIAVVLWIAWRVATASGEKHQVASRPPITFWQSVVLQWINPKAWAGALTIVTIYTRPERYIFSLFAAAFVTIFMTFAAVSLWSLSGNVLNRLMRDPVTIRRFNLLMAFLLILSVGMMLF